jgi:hypothetical protein
MRATIIFACVVVQTTFPCMAGWEFHKGAGGRGQALDCLGPKCNELTEYLLQINNNKFMCKKPTKCTQVEKTTWYLDYWWRAKMVKLLQTRSKYQCQFNHHLMFDTTNRRKQKFPQTRHLWQFHIIWRNWIVFTQLVGVKILTQ